MMNQEYFNILLSPQVCLGIPLENMGVVIQLEISNICPVPGVADFWYGVTNHKGSLLWVLDSDRYFDLGNEQNSSNTKITAVVLKHQQEKSNKKIAIIAQKLIGIAALEIGQEEDNQDFTPNLRNCCSPGIIAETKSTYILNPGNLLQQLQQSSLLSA